jgi:hypothetical protein
MGGIFFGYWFGFGIEYRLFGDGMARILKGLGELLPQRGMLVRNWLSFGFDLIQVWA